MMPTTPIDPDIDLHITRQRRELSGAHWSVLGTISAGGAVGALARYGIGVAFPHDGSGFPWATFAINVSGCFLIGVLMTIITLTFAHRLVRPFLGVGVLGGYTTFSTYTVDIQQLLDAKEAATALAYLASTIVAALVAVWIGVVLARLARTPASEEQR